MRALITGINGFVGGHLAEYLVNLGGWNVWGLALEDRHRLPHLQDDVRLLPVDLCDTAQVVEAVAHIQPHVIIHLAGQSSPGESFRIPEKTLHINIMAQLSLLLAVIEHQPTARVLVIGSGDEYGLVRPDDIPIDENTPLRPANPYGVSKVAQDMLALQYHLSHGLDIVRVRPFNHIGPRQSKTFVASAFARQIACIEHGLQPPLLQVGNLNAQRDFTDVRDMVRAYVCAIESGEAGQVYNIGDGHAVKISDMLTMLLEMSRTPIEVEEDPQRIRPLDVPVVVCNARRFSERTGWQPRITLQQTLQDILDDWRTRIQTEEE